MQTSFKNAVLPLVIINIVIFIIQQIVPAITENFALVSADVLARPWILVTSTFLHGSIWHLLFNMYALFLFGNLIEHRIGTKRFLLAYFGAGILAGIAATFFYTAAIGASGAIMAILGLTIMLLPDLPVLFFFVIPMNMRVAGIIFALVDIFGLFTDTGIAHVAHLAGLACGLLYGWYLLRLRKAYAVKVMQPHKRKHAERARGTQHLSDDDIQDYFKRGRL